MTGQEKCDLLIQVTA